MCLFAPQVVSSQFTKSVIRSRAALTYAEAQSRIDDERLTDDLSVRAASFSAWGFVLGLLPAIHPNCLGCPPPAHPADGPSPDSPKPQVNLRTMNQLAKILRQKRADRGALSVRRAPRTFGQALAGVRAGRRLWCAGMTVFRAGCATLYAPVS